MEVKAKLKYLRISPRKVRLVADLIRGKNIEEAQDILKFTVKRASLPLNKLLDSAISNAKNNFHLNPDVLYIKKITVDEGPKYKRWMPRMRGQAYQIKKKTSHITLILDEKEELKKKTTKKQEVNKIETEKQIEENKKENKEKKIEKKQKPKFNENLEKNKIKAEKGKTGVRKIFRRKAI